MPPAPRLKNGLQASLLGVPQAGLPDRTFARGQGCWNCIHAKSPVDRWLTKRATKLAYAVQIALQSPNKEDDPEVVAIRRQVDQIDGHCRRKEIYTCDHGRTADGQPVGDFVASAFLCDQWSGQVGASLARADNGKLDDLPEELRDKIDGSQPMSLADFKAKAEEDLS